MTDLGRGHFVPVYPDVVIGRRRKAEPAILFDDRRDMSTGTDIGVRIGKAQGIVRFEDYLEDIGQQPLNHAARRPCQVFKKCAHLVFGRFVLRVNVRVSWVHDEPRFRCVETTRVATVCKSLDSRKLPIEGDRLNASKEVLRCFLMRLATFNVQNLRLRERDGQRRLDAARDGDIDYAGDVSELAEADRRLTAKLLAAADADVVALQEVFDQQALDFFYDEYLAPTGAGPYPVRICLPGNDGRGYGVALLSRTAPVSVYSHASETGRTLHLAGVPEALRDAPVFRRDCLEVNFPSVSLFVCHFKAPYPDAARARDVRLSEARAVRRIIESRFADPATAFWIIAGDFNEHGGWERHESDEALQPLIADFAVDLAVRGQEQPDWTYETPDARLRTRPDRILVSPGLAKACPNARVHVLHSASQPKRGLTEAPHPSDHAVAVADFAGL